MYKKTYYYLTIIYVLYRVCYSANESKNPPFDEMIYEFLFMKSTKSVNIFSNDL